MKAKLLNQSTGAVKEIKVGFSWTTFFFGFFVPLFRGDIKWALIMLVISIVLGVPTAGVGSGIVGIIFSFMYNKFYTKDLLAKGYEPASDADRSVFNSKGYLD